MINALENWREFALEIKWKRADHNNPFLIRINEACDEIERFFNPKDFDPEIKPDPDNWMLHLLTNKQLSSITFISEIAELLRHLRQIDAYGIYNLIDNSTYAFPTTLPNASYSYYTYSTSDIQSF